MIYGEIRYWRKTIPTVISTMSNKPKMVPGRNQIPITNTNAYNSANNAVVATVVANFKPIFIHL